MASTLPMVVIAFVLAQANLAVHGRVTDSTGALLSGVEVLVTNLQARRIPRLTMSGDSGEYSVNGLAAGRYRVTTYLSGVTSDSVEINLTEAGPDTVDFTLKVVPVSECPAILCETDPAERILSKMWGFPMQRLAVAPGNAKSRADQLRKQAITKQMHALGKAAIPALILALQDPDVQMRRNAGLLLMDLAAGISAEAQPALDISESLPRLMVALKDTDEEVRALAAQSIGYIGPAAKKALPALRDALNDSGDDVRRLALAAIRKIEKP